MARQSLRGRLAARLLPVASQRVFPSDWLEAGNDQILLHKIAARRRSSDGKRPDALLRRHWTIATSSVAGRDLHVLTPRTGSTGRLMFYCHGGAYVVGPSTIEWLAAASLARKIGADLALYDYPKVPEHDATATLPATQGAWAQATAGYDPDKVIIAGMSAGGGLATSIMLHLAATDGVQPVGAYLISPWFDVAAAHPDAPAYDSTDLLLPIDTIRRDGELYAGSLGVTDPLVSPRYATDNALSQLPSLLIALGQNELFVPEGNEFAERIETLGGSAQVLTEPFGQHASSMISTPESAALRATVVDTLSSWLDGSAPHT